MAEEKKTTKKEKVIDPMKELLKKQREERKALTQQIKLSNYEKLMNALKAIYSDKDDDAIITHFVLEAAKTLAEKDKAEKAE